MQQLHMRRRVRAQQHRQQPAAPVITCRSKLQAASQWLRCLVLVTVCCCAANAQNSSIPRPAPSNAPRTAVNVSAIRPTNSSSSTAAALPLPSKWTGTGAGAVMNTTAATADGAGTAVSSFVPGPCGHTPTKWGYQCGYDTQQGVHLYWSVDIPPPFNPCTGIPSAAGNYANQIHFLAEMWLPQGRLEVSFTDEPGVLYPAFVVAGSANSSDRATGGVVSGKVTAYHKINVRDEALGYSTAINSSRAVRQRGSSSAAAGNEDWDKTMLLCFTRHITNTSLPVGQDLRTRMLLGWAAYDSEAVDRSSNIEQPTISGTASINIWTGVGSHTKSSRHPIIMAHGIMMIAAFGALLPLAALLNRHEWIFGMGQDTSRSWAWYFIRIITQVVALGTALAGVVMVLAAFGNRNPGHGLWVWHQALGLLAMGMAVLQLPLWAMTRRASREVRALSNAINLLGCGIGIANLFIGVVLVHKVMFEPLQEWATPAAVVGGFTITVALSLEMWRVHRGHDADLDLAVKDHDHEQQRTPRGIPTTLAPIKTRVGQLQRGSSAGGGGGGSSAGGSGSAAGSLPMSEVVATPYSTPGSQALSRRTTASGNHTGGGSVYNSATGTFSVSNSLSNNINIV